MNIMKMSSEYFCGNDEDTPQNSVNLMNIIREYPALHDRKSKYFKHNNKKANARKKVASRGRGRWARRKNLLFTSAIFDLRALFHDVTR